jgi:hypothetical protein
MLMLSRWPPSRLAALAILTLGSPDIELSAQAPECTPYVVRCNYYAKFYRGTVTQVQTLKSEGKTTQVTRDSVTVTIGGGQVSCSGTTSVVRSSSDPPYKYTEQGTVSGEGLFILETPKGIVSDATYTIRIACPKPATQWRKEEAGQPVKTGAEPSEPADLKTNPIEVIEKPATDFAVLQGSETLAHPESDEVNGVAGTLRLAWRLTGRLPVPDGKSKKP